jgi:hypothetical protein
MRKIVLLFALIATMSGYVISQPQLTWQFANFEVINMGTQLQFDVEVKADAATTFHRDLQVYFDYNTAGFGSDVVTGGNISIAPLTLLDNFYVLVNPAGTDNTTSKVAIITEASNEMTQSGSATYFNSMPSTFTGLLRITMDIIDNTETAGISFDEDLMDGGQYYQSASTTDPIKYLEAGVYDNDLITNKLSTAYGNITYANVASTPLSNITVKLMSGAVETAMDVSDVNGDYNMSSMDDGSYTLENSTTKVWGGLNGLDIILAKRYIASLLSLTPLQILAADVNQNGSPDGLDVIMMKRRIASLTYPAWTAPDYVFEAQTLDVISGIGSTDYQGLCSGDVNGSFTPAP